MKKIRLLVRETELGAGKIIKITDNDFDYLTKVMRKKTGDELLIFNGRNGEWLAKIVEIEKKFCQIQTIGQNKEQYFPPNITLAFAPVKNARIDFIAAKATELGIRKFQPIITQHTIVDKINLERFEANIKEAAEQCERLDLPEILEPIKLDKFLRTVLENEILILCDEQGSGKKAGEILPNINPSNSEIIIFTGPEGGFSAQEFEQFDRIKNLHKITLGPRILRADTAIISAITLVQEFLGDFNLKPNFSES
ncbi:MAG: rRNA ((1498)-N(3))-methyltransferase [Rickettsiaceae bacterium]|jgi:16S rRNA (uracil1498-N3)-methyltransferase|nr:rRNA ((1498)-N(3))-methyltransferase [Rickettsiaceae bacterium]